MSSTALMRSTSGAAFPDTMAMAIPRTATAITLNCLKLRKYKNFCCVFAYKDEEVGDEEKVLDQLGQEPVHLEVFLKPGFDSSKYCSRSSLDQNKSLFGHLLHKTILRRSTNVCYLSAIYCSARPPNSRYQTWKETEGKESRLWRREKENGRKGVSNAAKKRNKKRRAS